LGKVGAQCDKGDLAETASDEERIKILRVASKNHWTPTVGEKISFLVCG
jgi:hypothetical protein